VSQEPLRVEFRVDLGHRRPAPKPESGAKAERQRVDRAARRARNLALAYWIDHLIRSGEVTDLAAVARMWIAAWLEQTGKSSSTNSPVLSGAGNCSSGGTANSTPWPQWATRT
jgi:hypothetical protein